MTIVVSCILSDGVILGTDSAITVPAPDGKAAKVYENAEKLFQLGDLPIGIATFGLAGMGTRSVGSYLREFEVRNPNKVLTKSEKLEDIVEALRSFLLEIYTGTIMKNIEVQGNKFEDIPIEKRPFLGFIVGGFSKNEYLPEVWEIVIPHNGTIGSCKQLRARGQFGTNWFALFGPIQRYMSGIDTELYNELMTYFAILRGVPFSEEELKQISAIIQKHENQIPYWAMSIREGIDHTRFLIDLVISHYRFALGDPVVGGKAQLGKVTYKGEKFEILNA